MTHNISEAPKPAAAPKLLDRIRLKHDNKRTALAYWGWIKRYSLFLGSVAKFSRERATTLLRAALSGQRIELRCDVRPLPLDWSWPLRIMCMSSIPARVMAGDQNDLNPSMGRVSRLIARWPCSTLLFRYFTWRSSMLASLAVLRCRS